MDAKKTELEQLMQCAFTLKPETLTKIKIMNTKQIIENKDLSKFLKLKKSELIAFIHSFGITEGRITGKYVKNMDQTDLRHLAMNIIKEQRELVK